MGVLNVTPDSFSDGAELGRQEAGYFRVDVDKALYRADQMVAEGAALLDVGGESTRPGASEVGIEEELSRVIPVIEAIRDRFDVCISVDSSAPAVITAAVAAGAELINDIRALTSPGALAAAAATPAAVCLMHMQGKPRTMQQTYDYQDVVAEVKAFLLDKINQCEAAGIPRQRLLLDPGFGFGKSPAHNFRLLRELGQLASLDLPLLVGISRKSMIGAATGRSVEQRLAGSVAAVTLALQGGARIVRSHDVAATMDAIRVHCAYRNS